MNKTRDRQDVTRGIERFSTRDLNQLRSELLRPEVDSFHAAVVISNFLTSRGYGCSTGDARNAASKIERCGKNPELIQTALEIAARMM